MDVLALTSQKGGSGKTTLAGHIAVAADAAGNAGTDPPGIARTGYATDPC